MDKDETSFSKGRCFAYSGIIVRIVERFRLMHMGMDFISFQCKDPCSCEFAQHLLRCYDVIGNRIVHQGMW